MSNDTQTQFPAALDQILAVDDITSRLRLMGSALEAVEAWCLAHPGGGGSPGGSSGQVQWNNADEFDGIPGSDWNGGTLSLPALSVPSLAVGGALSAGTSTFDGDVTDHFRHTVGGELFVGQSGNTGGLHFFGIDENSVIEGYGSSTRVGLELRAKSIESVIGLRNSGDDTGCIAASGGRWCVGDGMADQIWLQGATTGNPVTVNASGSDPDIDLLFNPKGAGINRSPAVFQVGTLATNAGRLTALGLAVLANSGVGDSDLHLVPQNNGIVTTGGSLSAGKSLILPATTGSAVLVGGTVTILNAFVKADSVITPSFQVFGGTPGLLSATNIVPGVSFDIVSNSVLDTSTVGYVLVNHS